MCCKLIFLNLTKILIAMERNMWTSLCQLLLFGSMLHYGFAFDQPPRFIKDMNDLQLSEDTQPGTIVYRLNATDPEGREVKYSISTNIFDVDEETGIVTLVRHIDYENSKLIHLTVTISDGINKVPRDIVVGVKDTNDVIPHFSRATYFEKVLENAAVGTVILKDIKVNDDDGVNDIINVTCNPGTDHQEDCQTFMLDPTSLSSSNTWEGQLKLAKPLNYETKKSYQVPLVAFDGVNKKTQSIEIQVLDVADSPPYFVKAFPVSLSEVTTLGTYITTISAKDGDKFTPRRIHYEIYNASLDYFKIDPVTGIITNKVPLDREDSNLEFGIEIPLKVREVISENPLDLGNTPSTTATTTIQVTLVDVNDNMPTFSSNYTSSVPEDIINDSVVPQLTMTVNDKDTRLFSNYSIHVETFNHIFVAYPKFGEGLSTVGLRVRNTSLIDYEKGPRVYNFKVIAREINTKESHSGSTYVTIHVTDANDNAPRVIKSPLETTVPENAAPGFKIFQINAFDDDSGDFGTDGIRYVSLKGIGQELFSLDPITGIVELKNCITPGKSPCLDYEAKQQYNFNVLIVDNKNNLNSKQTRVDLIINVEDANDNAPIFSTSTYYGKMLEMETTLINDILLNQVTDLDTVGTQWFSIINQTVPGLFGIDRDTGKLTAVRPVKMSDVGSDNYNTILVAVTDSVHDSSATVKIQIIDVNNNKPNFLDHSPKKCISEETPGGSSVIQLQATDLDKPGTPNSEITYSIVSGSDGFFYIEQNGVIKTTFQSIFNYNIKKTYTLKVMAKDNGFPPYNDTILAVICIIDVNNVIPYFDPITVRVDIKEDIPVGTEVIDLKAYDSDMSAKLKYSFIEPSNAINPNGLIVIKANYNYTNLFEMNPDTGKIITAKKLNRDRVSLITHSVQVVDIDGKDQTGTGTIIINILDVNKIPPRFTQPWTPANPYYNVTLNEEQSVGSSVITLNAVDDDGSIEGYELEKTKGYFGSIKGVVTVKKRIDYEVIEHLSFLAYAWDNVEPKMTATATVFVTIKNINDNSPLFKDSIYSFIIEENSPPGQSVGFVSATDIDKGTYGNVRYSINDTTQSFKINEFTGEITVRNSSALDREKVKEIILQVTAYDSPAEPSVRKFSSVFVYITLKDQNDNAPVFTRESYQTLVQEGVTVGTSIFEVSATDDDTGVNAFVTYKKLRGDYNNLFSVSSTGVIGVRQSLLNKVGMYNFQVIAYSGILNSVANVTIEVVKDISAPPEWIIPVTNNEVINVLESQYKGMFVYQVKAESLDPGPKGRIKYGFINSLTPQSTNEFYINPITGVISALIIFDRERQDLYTLQVIAEDSNIIPQASERRLNVKILDVNDNTPLFTIYDEDQLNNFYNVHISEDSKIDVEVLTVVATDRDLNDTVYYKILSGNSDNVFSLNQSTGRLILEKQVDRENINSYFLNIEAVDSLYAYDLLTPNHIRRLERNGDDLNVARINIQIDDVNDEVPKFSQTEYYGCISTDEGFLRSILTVKAIDKDSLSSLEYTFANLRTQDGSTVKKQILTIGRKNGIIRNRESMDQYKDTVFLMDIIANDTEAKNATDTAKGLIFVTEKSQAVKVTVAQPPADVHYFIPQIKKLLSQKSENGYICISDIREHILPSGTVNRHWSDVFIYVIKSKDGKFTVDGASTAVSELNTQKSGDEPAFSGIYIQKIKVAQTSDDLKDSFSILLIMILVIFFVLLAILLFCIACCCIAQSKKKNIDKVTYANNMTMSPEQPKDFQPQVFPMASIYDNKGFFPEDDKPVTETPTNVTPNSYTKSFDFNDEDVPTDPDGSPLYSVVNKHPNSVPTESPPEFPVPINMPEPSSSDGSSDPEPVITTSLSDPVEEPQIECELEPEFETEPYPRQMPDYNPPPTHDEPVIVTEIDEAR